nr:hypothetical protein [Tanacetum cinerariifolium]
MRMEQYLTFTDHALWEVIVNGDLVSLVASTSAGAKGPILRKTVEQKLARKKELKAKGTLMLALPNEHLLKFYAYKDAKSLWEAIKNSQEGLNKTYNRFQKLISQLEIHGVSDGSCMTVPFSLGLVPAVTVVVAVLIVLGLAALISIKEDASKQGRMIDNIDQDVEITLVDDTHGRMNEEDMFGVNDLDGDEVVVDVSASEKVEQSVKVVEKEVSIADPVTTAGEVVATVGIEVATAGIEVTTSVTTP